MECNSSILAGLIIAVTVIGLLSLGLTVAMVLAYATDWDERLGKRK